MYQCRAHCISQHQAGNYHLDNYEVPIYKIETGVIRVSMHKGEISWKF